MDALELAFHRLHPCLEELTAIAPKILLGISLDEEHSERKMAGCYVLKQFEHASAVLQLSGMPDAALVARSMLEGLWQWLWAAQDLVGRSELWIRYSVILDWRKLQNYDVSGEAVDDTKREAIASGLRTYGHLYTAKPESKSYTPSGTVYRDTYTTSWHGHKVWKLAELCDDLEIYHRFYARFSERHHWDVAEMARSVTTKEKTLDFSGASWSARAAALDVAFTCVYRTASSVDETFVRGFAPQLRARLDAYRAVGSELGVKLLMS